ncbi:DNA-3-methyladenine glycosylase [Rubidibacter lacunae]|nr:DNA-3-methyladenine glycosylase [Rubidibacter lacunae]
MPLDPSFLQREPAIVARELLGAYLARRLPAGETVYLPIVEVEIYEGFKDKASHAHRGRTPRNAVMFEPGGCFYVYLCYGVHWLLNAIAGPADYPAAILLRGAGAISGPGRLTKHLQVDRTLDGQLAVPKSGLWFAESGITVAEEEIEYLPRVGIASAGEEWAHKPLRLVCPQISAISAAR